MKDYAKRTCVICGAEFTPSYPSQVCCTNKCKRHRKAYRERCHKARQADTMSALVRRVAALKKGMRTLNEKLNRLPDPVKPVAPIVLPADPSLAPPFIATCDTKEKGYTFTPVANPPELPTCDSLSHPRAIPTESKCGRPAKTVFKCTCLACGKTFNADRPTQTTCASCLRKYATPNLHHYRDPSYQG